MRKGMVRRCSRKSKAKWFRLGYIYGSNMGSDRKTCIWSGDGDSWLDKSSGIMWVGVHGMDSLCVVSRTGDLDIKRVCGCSNNDTVEAFLHDFRKSIISEIEDLADPSYKLRPDFEKPPNKLRNWTGQSIKKPFGIVSVGTDEVHEECGEENKRADPDPEACEKIMACVQRLSQLRQQPFPTPTQRDETNTIKFLQKKMETDIETVEALEYDDKKAIQFLREKMESGVAFTMDETIQAAISAFQHLFGKKFKAHEIGVTVMDPDYDVLKHEAKYEDVTTKELEIHDIEKHLAVINEPAGSGGSTGNTVTAV